MNDVLKAVIISLIPSLIVAIFTAKLTVTYSINQFRTEKWWDKKHETYSNIVTCLSKLLYCYRKWTEEFDDGEPLKLSDESKKKLMEKYNTAIVELHEIANACVFNISEKASEEIKNLRDEIDNEFSAVNWFEDAPNKHLLIESCIRNIKVYAQEDLNIKKL